MCNLGKGKTAVEAGYSFNNNIIPFPSPCLPVRFVTGLQLSCLPHL